MPSIRAGSRVWRDLMIPEDPSSGLLVLPVHLKSRRVRAGLVLSPWPPRSCPTARSRKHQAAAGTDRYRGTGPPVTAACPRDWPAVVGLACVAVQVIIPFAAQLAAGGQQGRIVSTRGRDPDGHGQPGHPHQQPHKLRMHPHVGGSRVNSPQVGKVAPWRTQSPKRQLPSPC